MQLRILMKIEEMIDSRLAAMAHYMLGEGKKQDAEQRKYKRLREELIQMLVKIQKGGDA